MARPLPPPDVPLVDLQTGKVAQVWFDYFRGQDRFSSSSTVGGGNSSSVWFYGSALPASSLGIDGDFYIRTSGTSIIAFYVKQSGTWA